MRLTGLLILFALVTTSRQVMDNYRLPKDSRPYNYQMELTPHINPKNPTFEGVSIISLKVLKITNNLTLHASKLLINQNFTNLVGGGESLIPNQHVFDVQTDFLILVFSKKLKPGDYKLHLKYSGMLSKYNTGFFIDYYLNDKKEKMYFVSTFFEATQAREAFPCWDEPAFKATFEISIRHLSNYTALSNMPMKKKVKQEKMSGKIVTEFETTPLMSTYIVSFMVSDFHKMSNSEGNFSVWARKDNLDFMKFGYDIGLKALIAMEEYTNISYHLPKLDIVAIPSFENGGMENWGLIVFREDYIFRDNESSLNDNMAAAEFVVHEITHQWFGNLISPAWWQDLWLTEGIATYFQFFLTGKVAKFPRILDLFHIRNNFRVYDADYIPPLPVAPVVNNREEIHDFLNLVHDKAATVIQMLSCLFSEDVFHNGLRKLLRKYEYKTITSDDFWGTMQDALQESKLPQGDFNIKKVMDNYIYKAGYPVVNVTRDYKTGLIKLSQRCVVCEKLKGYKDKDRAKWWIPISFVTSSSLNFSSTLPTHWMNPEEEELIIEGVDPDDWIIINVQRSAYYRVNYDEINWNRIVNYLNSEKYSNIHVLNRAQLIEDASFFYQEKLLDSKILLRIISFLHREVDYIPWVAAFRLLEFYIHIPEDSEAFKNYTVGLLTATINETGLIKKPTDDLFTVLKREAALDWTCRMIEQNC